MKDNLIDEEKAKEEEAAQETTEQKLDRLGKLDKIILSDKSFQSFQVPYFFQTSTWTI